jgi:succinoglycan biosynthesis protein ExoV
MDIFYWKNDHGNFGDDLNTWLWDWLLPGIRECSPEMLLVGVGTVLVSDLLPADRRKLVLGSGAGYNQIPDVASAAQWDIRMVRGAKTAASLGLAPELGIVDPAVVIADMPEFSAVPKRGGTIFVPHWESAVAGNWEAVCAAAGIGYVDPTGESKSVIRQLAEADLVIAESMHAAILADAFRVPWIPVVTSEGINDFKWRDWAESVDAPYVPRQLPLSSLREKRQKAAWHSRAKHTGQNDAVDPGMLKNVVRGAKSAAAPAVRVAMNSVSAMMGLTEKAAASLASVAEGDGCLSVASRLDEKKALFYEKIEAVRRDYL